MRAHVAELRRGDEPGGRSRAPDSARAISGCAATAVSVVPAPIVQPVARRAADAAQLARCRAARRASSARTAAASCSGRGRCRRPRAWRRARRRRAAARPRRRVAARRSVNAGRRIMELDGLRGRLDRGRPTAGKPGALDLACAGHWTGARDGVGGLAEGGFDGERLLEGEERERARGRCAPACPGASARAPRRILSGVIGTSSMRTPTAW